MAVSIASAFVAVLLQRINFEFQLMLGVILIGNNAPNFAETIPCLRGGGRHASVFYERRADITALLPGVESQQRALLPPRCRLRASTPETIKLYDQNIDPLPWQRATRRSSVGLIRSTGECKRKFIPSVEKVELILYVRGFFPFSIKKTIVPL
ncbi:hypothetical protein JTB14_030904 [Gonioctena quinquepunctata]|nr:hypothetical protein JTB14_030904 [Gonioctena quinquepunctata]